MAQDDKLNNGEARFRVDENWKKGVAEEKAKTRGREEPPRARGEPAAPQPTIEAFMAGLYTQTLIALGEVENPLTGKKETHAGEAAYVIDVIAMIQAKTQGNLTPEESSYVQRLLTDLRMRYVRVAEAEGAGQDKRQPGKA